jgi:hypothetical protein
VDLAAGHGLFGIKIAKTVPYRTDGALDPHLLTAHRRGCYSLRFLGRSCSQWFAVYGVTR